MSLPKINEIFHLDKYSKTITSPNIILTTKNFKKIGLIKYTNWNFSFVGNGMDEITFDVIKPMPVTDETPDDLKQLLLYEHEVWNNLVDMKLIEVQGYGRFEIQVNYTDNEKTIKSVHGFSLECELSQLYLNDFHVNDEDAMSNMEITEYNRDNFDSEGNFIPTTLCNFSDEKHSLLHRVIAEKAPHWKIGNQDLGTGYITPFISLDEEENAQLTKEFQRTFTCDGESIYDFLTDTVANEANVIFIFDTLNRVINCYSLCDCVLQSNGEIMAKTIGEDTNIFITKDKLANEININSEKDNVKNCFRVVGGDDVITSMIPIANVNGSSYLVSFSDAQYKDMSNELADSLKNYQKLLKDSKQEAEELFLNLCKAYDEKYYLESSMMPAVALVEKTAQQQYEVMINKMKTSDFFVAVQSDYTSESFIGVSNNVTKMAQILVDSRFEVSIVGNQTYNISDSDDYIGVWTGKFRVINKSNEVDCYPVITDEAENISIKITKDVLSYAEQKLEKALQQGDMLNVKFDLEDSKYLNTDGSINKIAVTSYFGQYCLNRLISFHDGYETCLSILAEMGQKDDGTDEKNFYDKYVDIRNIVKDVKNIRQKQVDEKIELINELNQQRVAFQEALNLKDYLGDYYLEFCSYRREDTYTNNNYISDGLSDAECLEKAKELLEVAQKEINKACVLQRTLSSDLNNLFMLEEFEPLYDKFALFNYVRLQTDDEILKLRLIGIEINGESLSNINVTFSDQIESINGNIDDLKSILDQASSMSSSFPATVRQAKKGQAAKEEVENLYTKGLNAAKMLLTNSQNNEVTFGGYGMLCKNQGDTGDYGLKQLRVIGNGIYLTEDAWEHVKMAIGQIQVGDKEKYGIIADTIVAGSIIDGTGENYWNLETGEFVTKAEKELTEKINETNTNIVNQSSNLSVTFEGIVQEAIKEYVKNDDLGTYKEEIKGELSTLPGKIQAAVEQTMTTKFNGLQEEITKIGKYFDFELDGLTIKSITTTTDSDGNTIEAENPYKLRIDNDVLVLTYNGQDVLWLKHSNSTIPSLSVTETFNFFGYSITQDEEGRVNCEYVGGED